MKRLYIFLSISVSFLGAIFLLLPKLEVPSCSPVLLDHSGDILCAHLSLDKQWRLPIRIEEVPPLYLKMLITYEDKRFYSHPGVDPIALMRGLWQWVKNRRIISGGSTLTMQTVRLMRPRPRTVFYKIEEILQALRLEWAYSKEEILTIYLTLAPYGGNVEGLRAASLTYFQQDPMQLTPAKMALMVVIPQWPTALRPHVYPRKAKFFRDKVLMRLKDKGIITADQCLEARNDPVPSSRAPFPMYAPHVLQNLRQRHPAQTVYRTTLIKKKQMALEALLRYETSLFESHQTAAALIIENGTRNIIAYVGSAYPFSETKNGYVDMILAIRSPGSALKPFIYALAFDENLIHPETLIEDVSTNFNGYMPTNFKDAFHGEVTIREALQQSLNIPVVHLLDRLGSGRFVDWLKHSGVSLYFSSKDRLPSLPIALGGVGIRLYDLATLYCALANGGRYASLTLVPRSSPLSITSLIQPAASWYVTRILEDAPAPSGLVDWFVTDKSPIAFKTGTSYGARDALCIGYTTGANGFTAAVWTGRADGSPSPNQLGRKTAAPILLKIFNTILLTKKGFDCSPPPEGVMLLTASQLPDALRWFRHTRPASSTFTNRPTSLSQNKGTPFQIISPQANTAYLLQKKNSEDAAFVPIPVKVRGGKPPFLLLVNGEPTPLNKLQTDASCDQQIALWCPTKIGFFELTLIDGEGHSDSVNIRMK